MRPAPTRKACRVCAHAEHEFLSRLLEQGVSPRAIVKRVGGVGRKDLARHQDRCLAKPDEKEADE